MGARPGSTSGMTGGSSSYTRPKANVSRIGKKNEPTCTLCWCFFSLPDSESASGMAAGAGVVYLYVRVPVYVIAVYLSECLSVHQYLGMLVCTSADAKC